MTRLLEALESRRLLHSEFSASINFAPLNAPRAPGLLTDYGVTYGVRRGGLSYGWSADVQANAVERNRTKVQKNDTFIAMPAGGTAKWEIGVENGNYDVYIVAGDPGAYNDRMAITVEGELSVSGVTRKDRSYLEGLTRVSVTDGKLTIGNAAWAVNNKIAYIGIVSTEEPSGRTLTVSVPRSTAKEGGSFGQIMVSRNGDTSESAVVPVTMSGTATNAIDYGRFGPRLVFAAGQQSITLRLRPIDDGIGEGTETAILTVSPIAGYQVLADSGIVTILDGNP